MVFGEILKISKDFVQVLPKSAQFSYSAGLPGLAELDRQDRGFEVDRIDPVLSEQGRKQPVDSTRNPHNRLEDDFPIDVHSGFSYFSC